MDQPTARLAPDPCESRRAKAIRVVIFNRHIHRHASTIRLEDDPVPAVVEVVQAATGGCDRRIKPEYTPDRHTAGRDVDRHRASPAARSLARTVEVRPVRKWILEHVE